MSTTRTTRTTRTTQPSQTSQEDQSWEQAQAKKVQAAKAALIEGLGVEVPHKAVLDDEAGRQIAATQSREDKVRLGKLLEDYQREVNRLWLYAENVGITEKLLKTWLGQNRKNLAGVDRVEYSSEATFAMRYAVANFIPKGTPLVSFAYRRVAEALTAYRNDRAACGTGSPAFSRAEAPEGSGEASR